MANKASIIMMTTTTMMMMIIIIIITIIIIIIINIAYLTEPEVTRKGSGVGHGEAGVLLTELLVLDSVLWGHCGGPPKVPGLALPPLRQHNAH